jgi:hypothetical protein
MKEEVEQVVLEKGNETLEYIGVCTFHRIYDFEAGESRYSGRLVVVVGNGAAVVAFGSRYCLRYVYCCCL